jgi:hypothetical protein
MLLLLELPRPLWPEKKKEGEDDEKGKEDEGRKTASPSRPSRGS